MESDSFLYLRGVVFSKVKKDFESGKMTIVKNGLANKNGALFNQNPIDPNNIIIRKSPNGKNTMYIITGKTAKYCINCSKKMKYVEHPLGTPVDYKDKYYICLAPNICDYGCLFSHIKKNEKDPLLENSRTLAFNMFENDYPGEAPIAKPDRDTYIVFGGSIDPQGVIQIFERKPITQIKFEGVEYIAS